MNREDLRSAWRWGALWTVRLGVVIVGLGVILLGVANVAGAIANANWSASYLREAMRAGVLPANPAQPRRPMQGFPFPTPSPSPTPSPKK